MCDNNDKLRAEFSPREPLLLRDLSRTMLEIKNAVLPAFGNENFTSFAAKIEYTN